MSGERRGWPDLLMRGRLDVLLAGALALLAMMGHGNRGGLGEALLDLAACAAAALTVRWPKAAGLALAAILVVLLFMPPEWASMAEYAPLVPILGAGLRGQRRIRLGMTVVFGPILAALTVRDMGRTWDPMVLFALGLWAALIGFVWVMGDLFTAYRRAQEKAAAAALQQQRIEVARELHDTVARDLSRASLQVQAAMGGAEAPHLAEAVENIQQASARLRWMMALLRDPGRAELASLHVGSVREALDEATGRLRARGLSVTTSVEGELDRVPAALTPVLCAAIGEACANIERHADPGQPCAIVVSAGVGGVDAVFLNGIGGSRDSEEASHGAGAGLLGMRERLAVVGGELSSQKEGARWMTRISLPL